jgi:transposase
MPPLSLSRKKIQNENQRGTGLTRCGNKFRTQPPNCKVIVKKTLSQRTHICECGCVIDRDEAAAINILAKALKELSRGGQSQTSSLELVNALWTHQPLSPPFNPP